MSATKASIHQETISTPDLIEYCKCYCLGGMHSVAGSETRDLALNLAEKRAEKITIGVPHDTTSN